MEKFSDGEVDEEDIPPAVFSGPVFDDDLSEEEKLLESEFLAQYSLDKKTLTEKFSLGHAVYIRHLINCTQIPVDQKDRTKQDSDREAVARARERIIEFVLNDSMAVLELCRAVEYESSDGLKDVHILKYVHNYFYDRFIAISNTYDDEQTEEDVLFGYRSAEILNHFSRFADEVNACEWNQYPHTNYLVAAYLLGFACEIQFSSPETLDNQELYLIKNLIGLERVADFNPDTLLPFEITKGQLALFGTDTGVLYVLDRKITNEVRKTFNTLSKKIRYKVAGQYFARRVVADLPKELEFETEVFYDRGRQLGRDLDYFKDGIQLRDYIYFNRRSMRETIEKNFGIHLKNLTINEQIYFLEYLKNTKISTAEIMQQFIQLYGIDAMRSFLALSQAKGITGDQIVGFGVSMEPEVAKVVFATYVRIIDHAAEIDQVVSRLDSKQNLITPEARKQITDHLLEKANNFFAKALQSANTENVVNELNKFSVEGALLASYTRTLYEQGNLSLESIQGMNLTIKEGQPENEQIEAVLNLYTLNYGSEYPRFIEEIREKLIETTKRTDATWYFLYREGVLIGSARFLPITKDGVVIGKHFGAFNMHPQFAGGKIGETMYMEFIKKEAEAGVPLHAECIPQSPISQKYIESGFYANGTIEFAGVTLFTIVNESHLVDQHPYHTITPADLVKNGWEGHRAREIYPDDTFPEFKEGKRLVRYFTTGGKKYGLFIK